MSKHPAGNNASGMFFGLRLLETPTSRFFPYRVLYRALSPGGNAVSYYFSDHLNTASVITDSAGNIKSESDYYPWGGELQVPNTIAVLSSGFEGFNNITVLSPGFEGNSAQGWGLGYWGATSYVTNAQAHSGGYSLAQTGATTGGSYQDVSGLVPGSSYQVSVWVRADAGTTAQMYLWLHDTTGANAENTAAMTPGQSWQQVTLSYVADSTGKLRIHLHYIAGAGTVYYDDVQILAPGGVADSNHYKFTGKERDGTGLDYFGARYYSNLLGRFITPDWSATPVAVPYADLSDPQSLNQYSYVRNIPTTKVDADGHDGEIAKGFLEGTLNFVVHTAEAAAISAIPVYGPYKTAQGIVDQVGTAGQEYSQKGVSGVANEVLDQGPQGAMAVTTEAVLTGGAAASVRVDGVLPERVNAPDSHVVVRGGESPMPKPGTKFSGAQGATVDDAAQGVPHGTIRQTTAGEIRKGGGSVRAKPELTRRGTMNKKHVNVREGTKKPSTFSKPKPNPVPKKDRIDGGK